MYTYADYFRYACIARKSSGMEVFVLSAILVLVLLPAAAHSWQLFRACVQSKLVCMSKQLNQFKFAAFECMCARVRCVCLVIGSIGKCVCVVCS